MKTRTTRSNPNGGVPDTFPGLYDIPRFYATRDRLRGVPWGGKAIGIVKRVVEDALPRSERDKIRDALVSAADLKILPEVLRQMDVIPDSTTAGYRVLEVVVLRDMALNFITPGWRLRLSYPGLLKSRAWVKRIDDPLLEPVRRDVCTFEEIVHELSEEIRVKKLDPPLLSVLDRVTDKAFREIMEFPNETVNDLALAEISDTLVSNILEPIEAAARF